MACATAQPNALITLVSRGDSRNIARMLKAIPDIAVSIRGAATTSLGTESEKLRMAMSGANSDTGTSRVSSIRTSTATRPRDGRMAIAVRDDTADQYGMSVVNARLNHSRTLPPMGAVQRRRADLCCACRPIYLGRFFRTSAAISWRISASTPARWRLARSDDASCSVPGARPASGNLCSWGGPIPQSLPSCLGTT